MRRGALICCLHDMRRLITTPRAWAVGILLLLFLDGQMQPIRFMMATEGQKISWAGMLVFLLNDPQVTLFTGLILLMLLFDVPMTDETQKYIIVRTGRASWAWGHVLYIAAAVAAYMLLFCVMPLVLVPLNLDWTGNWGTGLVALTEGMYEVYDSMLNYDPWLIDVYSPVAGMALAVLLKLMGFMLLGMIACAANVLFRTRLGFLAAAVPLMLDSVADEYFPLAMYYFSPVSLTRLSFLDYGDEMGRPPVWYGILVLAGLCAGLALLTVYLCRRREIRL